VEVTSFEGRSILKKKMILVEMDDEWAENGADAKHLENLQLAEEKIVADFRGRESW